MKESDAFLAHEKLEVYEKSIDFVRTLSPIVDGWPVMHSVRDQMDRASDSVVTNLVKASQMRRTEKGCYYLECSYGSILECAACLDVASVKQLINKPLLHDGKKRLQTIARMESGLRGSWNFAMHEERGLESEPAPVYFAHETLRVYQTGLALCKEIERIVPVGKNKRDRYVQRIDEASTSLVLNVAEGNGRYSTDQHRYFMDMAEEAGSKLAAYLDLFAVTSDVDVKPAKVLLRLAMRKIAGMKGYLTEPRADVSEG